MRFVPTASRRLALGATGLLLVAAPLGAAASPLGNPRMHVVSGTVPPPYSPNFVLSTAVATWPALAQWDAQDEIQKDAAGEIKASDSWWRSPSGLYVNWGANVARDNGTFSSCSEMQTPTSYQDHLGIFGAVKWSQSFRKDSASASYHYTISQAMLYTRCMTTGARAEFAADNAAYMNGTPFYSFHQDGGVLMFGNPPQVPIVYTASHGPMTWSGSNPDGIQRDYQMVFAGHTEVIDLSTVPVGSEFTVTFNLVTRAHLAYDEVVRSSAYVQDPGNESLGVIMELTGLTPTDDPQVEALAVEPASRAVPALSAPWPNPARGAVTFSLELPADGDVDVDVFDLSGRLVANVARGPLGAGPHRLTWDARDARGVPAPAGVYLVRAAGPGVSIVRRVVRLADR